MKPAPFDYFAPATVDEALALLAQHGGDAKPLAGGQSLIPAMNFRLARPAVLVDLNRLTTLAGIRGGADSLRIGAMTRQRAVERDATVARDAPLLAEARIALLSVGDGPVLAIKAAKAITGEKPTADAIQEAADAAASKDVDPPGDIHASAAYRRQLVGVLVRRALERACERARNH